MFERFQINGKWSWPDWTLLCIHGVWVTAVLIFMYQDQPAFPLGIILPVLLLCHLLPFFLVHYKYRYYLAAALIIAGGASVLLAYSFGLLRLFLPVLLMLGFYSRGRAHALALPLAVGIFVLSAVAPGSMLPLQRPFWGQSVADALVLYGVGFALQKGAAAIDNISNKLAIVKEQYTILEQYSSQIEKMTLLEERYRLARELHDTIGHSYTSLILGMESLRPQIQSPEGEEKLEALLGLARNGLDDIRRQVHRMDPLEESVPMDQALMRMIEEFKTSTGIRVFFRTMGHPYPVMKQAKLVLYRCLQESLTNASRHGRASRIEVTLQYDMACLMLQIQDNGAGNSQLQYGFGLTAMKDRLTALQGNLYIHSSEEQGTLVTCTVPNRTNEGTEQIKVLIVDDHLLVRESLRLLLGEEKDMRVRVAGDGKQAMETCERELPDLILMDIHMPEMDGLQTTKKVKEAWPGVRVIMMTTLDEVDVAAESLRLGAEGYLLKSIHPKELAATIRLVYSGGTMISPHVAQQLFQQQTEKSAANPYGLTERELDILQCLTDGKRNKAIAEKLHLSEGTIRNYISAIYLKLQVSDRDTAIAKAKKEQLGTKSS
ncbi:MULTISPECIES: hybrid sensor histidine kinase/response regulator transcription factor [Paenibacillus]|uniref:hybrid sensor histidine kinase/response regulator transcription factor n=1 Tax=Paenibacillus TaxID=44249 RepID=UPI002FE10F98